MHLLTPTLPWFHTLCSSQTMAGLYYYNLFFILSSYYLIMKLTLRDSHKTFSQTAPFYTSILWICCTLRWHHFMYSVLNSSLDCNFTLLERFDLCHFQAILNKFLYNPKNSCHQHLNNPLKSSITNKYNFKSIILIIYKSVVTQDSLRWRFQSL